jgi:hypothetical protein
MQNVVIDIWSALESSIYPNICIWTLRLSVYPSNQLHEFMINNMDFIITKKIS